MEGGWEDVNKDGERFRWSLDEKDVRELRYSYEDAKWGYKDVNCNITQN